MELKELYSQNPNATTLDLKNKNFTDAAEVFRELGNFKELIEVDLQGNGFEELPEDLSNLLRLRSLDVTNNNFTNVIIVVYLLII